MQSASSPPPASGARRTPGWLLLCEAAVKLAYACGFVVNAWGLAAELHEYRALGQAASSASLALLLAVWHARLGCVNSQYAACVLAGLLLNLLADWVLAQPLTDFLDYGGFLCVRARRILCRRRSSRAPGCASEPARRVRRRDGRVPPLPFAGCTSSL